MRITAVDTTRLSKVLNQEMSDVSIAREAKASNTLTETPDATAPLIEVAVTDFTSLATSGSKVVRNDATNLMAYTLPSASDALQIQAIEFDKDTGVLSIVRKNAETIKITGFATVQSLGRGPKGKRGYKGIKGQDGQDGRDGPTGYPGAEGPIGPEGPQGISGADGQPGANGRQGPEGYQGPVGPEGQEGPTGRGGHVGEPGYNGCQGVTGATGPTGPKPSGNFYIGTTPPSSTVLFWGYPV